MNKLLEQYKNQFESRLPSKRNVLSRNKAISAVYAQLYLDHPDIFKWAGMAAFASNHIGLGLVPYHLRGFKLLDLSSSCRKQGLVNDFNLLRHINNRIYEDIAWTHQAYLDGGIELLSDIMKGDEHYQSMLFAWINLDDARQISPANQNRNHKIWLANAALLRHEQEMVVQPMFDRFGALFKKVLTLCASLDFSPNHLKTDFKYHSSFLWYSYSSQFSYLIRSSLIPDLTVFEQRWTWLEDRVLDNWMKREREDFKTIRKMVTKIKKLKAY